MPSTFNGLTRGFTSFRKSHTPKKQSSKQETSSKAKDDKCTNDNPEEPSEIDRTTSASRKRSPNTRISIVSSGSSKSKRHLGSPSSNTTSSQGENVTVVEGEGSSGGKSHGEPNNMETDACATETGLVSTISSASSNSSSGYSSGRSNKQHANRGNSKSADGCGCTSNGKENRVPSSFTSKAGVANCGSSSPVPIIKNRPQRSFIGYVSHYEQFLRYTETDPKYRSEKSQGKILGLYKFCGEIGSGNFSKVSAQPYQTSPSPQEIRKRKRKRDPNSWQVEIRKKRRLLGESYLGYQTKPCDPSSKKTARVMKPARQIKPTCVSPACHRTKLRHCNIFSDSDRQYIFEHFWGDLDWQQKRLYVLSSVEKVPTKEVKSKSEFSKRSETFYYYLQRNGQKLKVCQKMFVNTLGLGSSQVFRWIKANKIGRKQNESGKRRPEKEATKWAKSFLVSLPKMESHYCRKDTSKLYLEPTFQSKAHLFRVYLEFCKTSNYPKIAEKKFLSIVTEMNIGIFKPKKDKCDTCCSYEAGNLALELWRAHISRKDEARNEKEKDKQDAIQGLCHAIALDVQSVKLSPMITASAMYYKTKLMVHNYSIFDLKTQDARCYWWNESEGDLVASVFATTLIRHLEEKYNDNLPVIIWSDGCTNQNRNKILASALLHHSQRSNKVITQKYLEKGHTHMEVDSVHAVIERALKGKPIYHPMDYVDITRMARKAGNPYEAVSLKHNTFLDYSRQESMRYPDIRPGSKTGDPCVTDLRQLLYHPSGVIEYKLNHSSDWQRLPKKLRNVNNYKFLPLYKQQLPISKRKYDDLQELLPVIPSKYHEFYKQLPK